MRVLYIDIDSLRPDRLGCYGCGRATSPNIDRLAAGGVRLGNCYASDVPCMPSRTSLFSGRQGIHHGCVTHTGTRAEPFAEGLGRRFRSEWGRTSWMRMLRERGIKTATFTGFAERHAAWHWYAGFEEIHDTGGFGHEIADDVVPKVSAWLQANGRADDWFLHVNLWDVHVPYRTPEAVGNRFAGEPLPDAWLTGEILATHRSKPGIRSARDALFLHHAARRPDLNPAALKTVDDVKRMVDGYDTAVSYADEHVGRLLADLEDLGVLDETAVIIGADHGECLGELNAYGGHCFADACTARVPMIVRWPGVTDAAAGGCDGGLHYHLDLAPTVCEMLEAEVPEAWDGRSFAGALRGEGGAGREHLVLSQLAQTCQRAVVFRESGGSRMGTGSRARSERSESEGAGARPRFAAPGGGQESNTMLYLRTFRSGFHPLPAEQLFNLSADPHELDDLAADYPTLTARASGILEDWQGRMTAGRAHGDPLREVLAEPPEHDLGQYIARLEETARGEWVERVRRRYEEETRPNG